MLGEPANNFALFARAFTKWRKYGALNYLLHACEMLRAHVKFNEVCPPQITSNLQTN